MNENGARPQGVISPAYREMQRNLHAAKVNYGIASTAFVSLVADLVMRSGEREILDYGAGKGRLGQGLKEVLKVPIVVHPYDPAIAEWSAPPAPCRFVACVDVLEHIEPDYLENVLDDLRRVTLKIGFFTVHTVPAMKSLPDGRNAHLIQRPPLWWLERLMARFEVVSYNKMEYGFWVLVEARKAS